MMPKNFINKNALQTPFVEYILNQRVIRLKPKIKTALNINIETWADVDKRTYMCWGDYWVKERMTLALDQMGFNTCVAPHDADVTIYLWGSPFTVQRPTWPFQYNYDSFNVVWFYSHPSKMTPDELKRYDMVFCLSKFFLEKIKTWNHPNLYDKALLSCTDFRSPDSKIDECDIVFVGNARGGSIHPHGRGAVYWMQDLKPNYSIKIYGAKWEREEFKWMHRWYAGQYWPYSKLNQLYDSAKINLVDGHDDMQKFGFAPMKIFDILASGGFVIAQDNVGVKEIFASAVPMYKNKKEMLEMIKYYLENPASRKECINIGMKIAHENNFKNRMQEMMNAVHMHVKNPGKKIEIYAENFSEKVEFSAAENFQKVSSENHTGIVNTGKINKN